MRDGVFSTGDPHVASREPGKEIRLKNQFQIRKSEFIGSPVGCAFALRNLTYTNELGEIVEKGGIVEIANIHADFAYIVEKMAG
jgi:hypothetical protein